MPVHSIDKLRSGSGHSSLRGRREDLGSSECTPPGSKDSTKGQGRH